MYRRMARQAGFTMVEMLAALAIATMMIIGLVAMINTSLEDARGQQAALYQAQMTKAAIELVAQNSAALLSAATPTVPVVVPLKGSPYQLATFLPTAVQSQNAYGQSPCLLVYTNSLGGLEGLLVTEGGSVIPDTQLGYIASNSGQGGGSIPRTNNPGGAAFGAFGAWSVATPNPANVSCSGTKTGVGHLASEIFTGANQAQNTDYLYRVSVPGDTSANAMQVPIILAQQTDYTACTAATGSIAADANSNVVSCINGEWQPISSAHWRAPVAAAADLGDLTQMPNPQLGDVSMTTNTGRAYTFNGAAWQAVAVDEQGNLNLGNQQTVGNACASNATNTTPVTTDSTGRVLSCQNGTWQTQSEILPANSYIGCTVAMASPGAVDYTECNGVPAGAFTSGPYSYNSTNGTYSYSQTLPVQLTKSGILAVSTWSHMNDGTCNQRAAGARAQLAQAIDIYATGSSQSLAHAESQSATLTDDSGGIENSLTQALTPGNYQVVMSTSWATYAVITTPWVSSYCGEQGQVIANTPVATGWTVNSYY
ncbi:MAG: prepilin-type N-terminal cleavage/methylation domain-containing protein [Pseudomonadota bacterium]|uniref:PulJ/GspJ family protein n=3 Tax=Burkholderiales TaxID=80840 RepID=UPI0010F91141|nr:prepilin-type N-terminal cleavage/methylation domain-containing protein [Burkholderia sp. 4M9327F10]